MKIATREITTALVVDSPTPLAPPVVVNPQAQLICTEGGQGWDEIGKSGRGRGRNGRGPAWTVTLPVAELSSLTPPTAKLLLTPHPLSDAAALSPCICLTNQPPTAETMVPNTQDLTMLVKTS